MSLLRRLDRPFLLALLVALLAVVPRTMLVAQAHSECIDDDYHLFRGVQMLRMQMDGVKLNDPPVGEALISIPLRVMGLVPTEYRIGRILHGNAVPVETITFWVATWKAILFVPMALIAFGWMRQLFGLASGWLGLLLVCFDPTFAGHLAPATIDVIGVEGIVISCYAWWRYFEKQTLPRLAVAALLGALAITLKHTAIILPAVILLMLAAFWIGRFREQSLRRQLWHAPLAALIAFAALVVLTGGIRPYMIGRHVNAITVGTVCAVIASLTIGLALGFRRRGLLLRASAVSAMALLMLVLLFGGMQTPFLSKVWKKEHPKLVKYLNRPLPAGWYIGSITHASDHADRGHRGFLLGERRRTGWLYYFPVVATYKVPIGFFVVGALGVASFFWRRPRFAELGIFIPMAAWGAFVVQSGINIGFRHFLPAYVFMLMWAGRAMLLPRPGRVLAWVGLGAGALHVLTWHPDYLSYVNFPREKVWRDINDSNLDWGQSLKQVRAWLDANPQPPGKTVYLNYFGQPDVPQVEHYLGDRVRRIGREGPLPQSGLLIIAPTMLMHVYDDAKTYRPLQKHEPVAVIGQSMLVFDLDAIQTVPKPQ